MYLTDMPDLLISVRIFEADTSPLKPLGADWLVRCVHCKRKPEPRPQPAPPTSANICLDLVFQIARSDG